MSILNDVLGSQGQQEGTGSVISAAGQLLEKAGGWQGLLSMLQQHGLGGAVQSWVGTGTNQPISGDQLGQALHNGGLGSAVQEVAGKLGMDQNDMLGKLSQMLPHAVDQATPNGQVPAEGQGLDMSSLTSLAGKLFGNKA